VIFQSDDFVIDDIGNKTLVFVNSKKNPTSDEYDHVLRLYRSLASELPSYRCLAITDGAGPTLQQRQQQSKEFGNILKNITTAVVSDAITVRFVVSSAALFIKTIRAFDVNEFSKALTFLGFPDEQHAAVAEKLSAVPKGRFKALDAALRR
jgi:hypothetical protein